MAKPDERVYRTIEWSADTYEPAAYALLPMFRDLEMAEDPAGEQFIPLTTARAPQPDYQKIFVIGLLAPSIPVTGRLLDRSASVQSYAEGSVDLATPGAVDLSEPPEEKKKGSANDPIHRNAREAILKACAKTGRKCPENMIQYVQAVSWLESNYGTGWGKTAPEMVGSNNWGAVHCPKDMCPSANCIKSKDSDSAQRPFPVCFKSYATPEDGAADAIAQVLGRGYNAAGFEEGVSTYTLSYSMRRGAYYGGWCPEATKQYGAAVTAWSVKNPDASEGAKACAREAITTHANLMQDFMEQIANASGIPVAMTLGDYDSAEAWYLDKKGGQDKGAVPADGVWDDWNDRSPDAEEAMTEIGKTAGTDLNLTKQGERFMEQQKKMIDATLDAMERIRNTPALKLLVNPISFKVSSAKIISDGSRSRSQIIVEHWGDEPDKISASGKLAGFYAGDFAGNPSLPEAPLGAYPGITRTARHYSQSFQNFMSLFLLYKNNGGVWLPDFFEQKVSGDNRAMSLSSLGTVYIYYDNTMYLGSFDSLNLTETDDKPYTLEYSFEFTVRATFLLDQVDAADTQYTYGASGLFAPVDAPANPYASLPTTTPDLTLDEELAALNKIEAEREEPPENSLGTIATTIGEAWMTGMGLRPPDPSQNNAVTTPPTPNTKPAGKAVPPQK